MPDSLLAQTLTRQNAGRALRQLRIEYRNSASHLNAINKAALNLEACIWYEGPDGELVIESATQTGLVTYHVDVAGRCDCKAGQNGRICWHQAAKEIISAARQPRMTDAEYARTVAACDELFA